MKPLDMKTLRTRLARGAANAFVINAFGVGLAFLAQLVAARALGVEDYGVFSFVLAAVMLFATAATLGFEMGLVRFASPYHDRNDLRRFRGVIRYAEWRVAAFGLAVVALGAVVFGAGIGPAVADPLRTTFLLGLAAVPLLALMRVRLTALRVFGRVAQALIPDKIVRESVFIIALLGVASVHPAWLGAPFAGAALAIGAAVSLVLITAWGRRAAPEGLALMSPLEDQRREWWHAVWPLWLLSLSQLAMRRVDVLVLGMMIGTEASGIFFACFVAAQAIAFPLVAVNFLFSPTIAALHARNDRDALQRAVTTTSWWTTAGAVAVGVPLMVLAPYVLSLFGPDFVAHADVLRVLVLGQLIHATAGSIVPLLAMTGRERDALSISLTSFGCKCALVIVLIPIFGILGAAIVEAVFRAGWNVAMGIAVWRRLGIVPSIFDTFRPRRNPLYLARPPLNDAQGELNA